MSAKPRSTYHHGSLRNELLAEALRVVESKGHTALSLRASAKALGVDVASVYRHFSNKQMLLATVAAHGFDALSHAMANAMEGVGRKTDVAYPYLLACGEAYVVFGDNHRHLYRLMFGGACTLEEVAQARSINKDEAEPPPSVFELLSDALDLCVEAELIDPEKRPNAEFLAWSAIHGAVSLRNDGRGAADLSNQDIAEYVCALIEGGLQW